MPITWKNVSTPSFSGANVARAAGLKVINDSIGNFSESAKDFGNTITDARTGEAVSALAGLNDRETYADEAAALRAGLGPNVDMTKFAEAQTARGTLLDETFIRNLKGEQLQGDIANNLLESEITQNQVDRLGTTNTQADATHSANIGRLGAATSASQASTARDVYGLSEDKRLTDLKTKDAEVVQKLMTFRQQLGNEVQDEDDVDEQVNEYAFKLQATPEALAGFNIAHNSLTERTDAEKRKAEILAAGKLAEAKKEESRLDREGHKDVAKIKSWADKYKNRNKGGRFTASLKRNPALNALFSDTNDIDYLDAATEFSDPRYDNMPSAELDNHLYNYIKKHKVLFESIDDQDFDAAKFRKMPGVR